jgi:hypothetical protein
LYPSAESALLTRSTTDFSVSTTKTEWLPIQHLHRDSASPQLYAALIFTSEFRKLVECFFHQIGCLVQPRWILGKFNCTLGQVTSLLWCSRGSVSENIL